MKFDIIKAAKKEQWAVKETFESILVDGEMSNISGGTCGIYIDCRTKLTTCIPLHCYHLDPGESCKWHYSRPL